MVKKFDTKFELDEYQTKAEEKRLLKDYFGEDTTDEFWGENYGSDY